MKTQSENTFDTKTIRELRQSGASLQQIADKIGRTKERVRQILVKINGSTKHTLLSTQQLYKVLGQPRNQIIELYEDGVITPAVEWTTGNHHYLLWSSQVAEDIKNYYNVHRLCKMCGNLIGKGRWIYCSEECYKEGQKYRYKNSEAKRRQLLSIKRYMKRRKQSVYSPSTSIAPRTIAPVARNETLSPNGRSYAAVP